MNHKWIKTTVCLIPIGVSLLVLYVLPLTYAFVSAFDSYSSVQNMLSSYARAFYDLFTDELFCSALRNMAVIYVLGGVSAFVLAYTASCFHEKAPQRELNSAQEANQQKGAGAFFTKPCARIKECIVRITRSLLFLPYALPAFSVAAVMAYFVFNTKYGIVSSINIFQTLQENGANTLNIFFTVSIGIWAIAFMSSLISSNQKRLIVPTWTAFCASICVYPLVFSPISLQKSTVTPALYALGAFTDEKSPVSKEKAACALLLMLLVLAIVCALNSLVFYLKDTRRTKKSAPDSQTHKTEPQTCERARSFTQTAKSGGSSCFRCIVNAASFLVAVCLIALSLWCALRVGMASLSTDTEIFSKTMLSNGVHTQNYRALFTNGTFRTALLNSAHYAVCTVLFVFVFASPVGYYVSRTKTKLHRALQTLSTLTLFVPSLYTGIFARFFTEKCGIIPTRFLLTVLYVLLLVPSSALWCASIFGNRISKQERLSREAQKNKVSIFFDCIIERKKTFATFAASVFIIVWNEYPFARLLVAGTDAEPLSTFFVSLVRYTRYHGSWGELFALAVTCAAPCAVLFLVFARRLCARPLLLFRP